MNETTQAGQNSEEKLVLRLARAGQREAQERLMRLYFDAAYRLALHLAPNSRDADGLIQAAFQDVFRDLSRFDLSGPFLPWFRKILVRRYRKLRQKQRIWPGLLFSNAGWKFDPDLFHMAGDSPELAPRRQEEKGILLKALARLPENQRDVVVLFDLERLSLKEIADILDVPVGTVTERLHRGRLNLLKWLRLYFKGRK